MQILKAHDQYGWITAIIEGRWVQAKVYDEPSMYIKNEADAKLMARFWELGLYTAGEYGEAVFTEVFKDEVEDEYV